MIKCTECGKEVHGNFERENRLCLRCEQKLTDHANERAEWHACHTPTGRLSNSEPNIQNILGSIADTLDKMFEQGKLK